MRQCAADVVDCDFRRGAAPLDLIGGVDGIARIVDRFYDLMDADPAYELLRAMHGADLVPMRSSLTGFLVGWLGGPRHWFEENPGKCMMSMHRGFAITPATAGRWVEAMSRALLDMGTSPDLAAKISAAFSTMASGMGRSAPTRIPHGSSS